jgi:predicted oxidoreductase
MPARLETLQARKKQIDAQIQAIKSREARNVRAKDTRRKIVIGSAALKLVEDGKLRFDDLAAQLSARDRKLFEETPNATTIAAMEEARLGGSETVTLEQYKAEVQALVDGETSK